MSWDIYGNTLRRGYCEVHPNVHEEYPCSLCYAEDLNRQPKQYVPQPIPDYPSYRIVVNVIDSERDIHTVIIEYEYCPTDSKDIMSISVYGCYPNLLKNVNDIFNQVRDAIVNIEGDKNVCFLTDKISII